MDVDGFKARTVARRRKDLGRAPGSVAVRVECECGRTLGRLVGSDDGHFNALRGIERPERNVSIGGRELGHTPSTVHAVGATVEGNSWEAVNATFDRYRIECPVVKAHRGRPMVRTYRRDTLAQRFERAVRSGRRSLVIDVDLP